jgi:hypothetical protein
MVVDLLLLAVLAVRVVAVVRLAQVAVLVLQDKDKVVVALIRTVEMALAVAVKWVVVVV